MPTSQGFINVLEGCRHNGCRHLLFASSSSVYGANTKLPFSVQDNVDHPISLYAASKKANELMAHAYSHLYRHSGDRPAVLHGLRSVGPARHGDVHLRQGDPCRRKPIKLFNHGKMRRDFTYVDDVVEAIVRLIDVRRGPIRLVWRQARSDQQRRALENLQYRQQPSLKI